VRVREILRHQSQLVKHSSLVPPDMFVIETVATDIDDSSHGDAKLLACWWYTRSPGRDEPLNISSNVVNHLQPINLRIVRALEKLFINHSVNSHGSTAENRLNVLRVLEDEVVPIEGSQALPSNATSELLEKKMISMLSIPSHA